jgi:hypothetical protein
MTFWKGGVAKGDFKLVNAFCGGLDFIAHVTQVFAETGGGVAGTDSHGRQDQSE